jgi:FdhD protein
MPAETLRRGILRISPGGVASCDDILASQSACRIIVDGRLAWSGTCSPGDAEALGLGFLLLEGLACAETPAPAPAASDGCVEFNLGGMRRTPAEPGRIRSGAVSTPREIMALMHQASERAAVHVSTGATHFAAVALEDRIVSHFEDVSRSAAMKKAVGEAWRLGSPLDGSILLLSSRVPRAFVVEAGRAGIPMLAAVSAPTAEAVDEAGRLDICLCGFVRGDRMNVYSSRWRLGR